MLEGKIVDEDIQLEGLLPLLMDMGESERSRSLDKGKLMQLYIYPSSVL